MTLLKSIFLFIICGSVFSLYAHIPYDITCYQDNSIDLGSGIYQCTGNMVFPMRYCLQPARARRVYINCVDHDHHAYRAREGVAKFYHGKAGKCSPMFVHRGAHKGDKNAYVYGWQCMEFNPDKHQNCYDHLSILSITCKHH